MGTERRTTWLSRAACRGSVAIESIAPMERAVWAPSGLRFQPTSDPRYPEPRSANPTDVPSRPVPRIAMRSIIFLFLSRRKIAPGSALPFRKIEAPIDPPAQIRQWNPKTRPLREGLLRLVRQFGSVRRGLSRTSLETLSVSPESRLGIARARSANYWRQ